MLRLDDVHTYYGHIAALKGISLAVEAGEIVALIGANGAGKTTTLRTISGLQHARHGTIQFEDRRIDSLPAHEIAARGIVQAPEGRRLFNRMTVVENLEMGAFTRRDRSRLGDDVARVFTLFPRLKERAAQKAGTLSGGEQQLLALAGPLVRPPTVFVADEPAFGLSPQVAGEVMRSLESRTRSGMTTLLVMERPRSGLPVADEVVCLGLGRVLWSGPPGPVTDEGMAPGYESIGAGSHAPQVGEP